MSHDTWAIVVAIGVATVFVVIELRSISEKVTRTIQLLHDIKMIIAIYTDLKVAKCTIANAFG